MRLARALALMSLAPLLVACAAAPTSRPADGPVAPRALGLEVAVPFAPTPLRLGDLSHLVYELEVRNLSQEPVAVTSVEVFDDSARVIAYDAEAVASRWALLEPRLPPEAWPAKGVVPPGGVGLVYLWLTAADAATLPASLAHALSVSAGGEQAQVDVEALAVDKAPPRVVSRPLAGHAWLAVNAPFNDSRHRRSVQRFDDGRRFMAQRYAIDLVRVLTPSGTHDGDPADNASYHAYGAEVLAVADGRVVAVKDGLPDNTPGADSRAAEMTYDTLAGNYIVLDIGSGYYVTYAHLQPASLRVAVGDDVKAGAVLGLVGNSGNSTEPHLHLHVCDAPTALRCQGRPWALARFLQQKLDLRNPMRPQVGAPADQIEALPVNAAVVHFDPPPAKWSRDE